MQGFTPCFKSVWMSDKISAFPLPKDIMSKEQKSQQQGMKRFFIRLKSPPKAGSLHSWSLLY